MFTFPRKERKENFFYTSFAQIEDTYYASVKKKKILLERKIRFENDRSRVSALMLLIICEYTRELQDGNKIAN